MSWRQVKRRPLVTPPSHPPSPPPPPPQSSNSTTPSIPTSSDNTWRQVKRRPPVTSSSSSSSLSPPPPTPPPSYANQFNLTVQLPSKENTPSDPLPIPDHPLIQSLINIDPSFSTLNRPKGVKPVKRNTFRQKAELQLAQFQAAWKSGRSTRDMYKCTCIRRGGGACLDLPQVHRSFFLFFFFSSSSNSNSNYYSSSWYINLNILILSQTETPNRDEWAVHSFNRREDGWGTFWFGCSVCLLICPYIDG